MECGKPVAAGLPPCEPMTVGEALLPPSEACQRAANGVFAGNPSKWPYSLLGSGVTDAGEKPGQRISSSFAEGACEGFPEGGGDE